MFARDQRGMVRKMLLEDVMFSLVRLQRHEWVLGSGSEKFRDCEFGFPVFVLRGRGFVFVLRDCSKDSGSMGRYS